jgi:hypothetical protein
MPEDPMPEDRVPADKVERLFGKLADAPLPAPSASAVVARGRQRRRRARTCASASAAVLIAAAALGAYQLAGLGTGRGQPVSPPSSSPSPTVTSSPGPVLPPAGSGPLILGLDTSNRIVMTRIGSTAAPVPVPGLANIAGGPSQVATNPAGGWVVTYSTNPRAPYGEQPARLATVTASGSIQPFGPAFVGGKKTVVSMAVSPDGSRLALVVQIESGGPGSAVITVMPMPGYDSVTRTWTFPRGSNVNFAKDLSWAPGGQNLTYAAGLQTGAGIGGAPSTLDTAAPGDVAPVDTGWPSGNGQQCQPDAGGWLGSTGRFAAVEECDFALKGAKVVFQPADPSTGTSTGSAIRLPGLQPGCGSATIDSSPDGQQILVGYCNALLLDSGGKITLLPGPLGEETAWAGSGISRSQS